MRVLAPCFFVIHTFCNPSTLREEGSETTDARMSVRARISSFGFSCTREHRNQKEKTCTRVFQWNWPAEL